MPTIKTISSPWPKALKERDTQNFAPASAEVFALLAGRNRWINEFLRGKFENNRYGSAEWEPAATPANPQGLTGVDHSGPPYGVALRHSVANYSSIRYASGTTPLNDERAIDVPGGVGMYLPVSFYNKPFAPVEDTPHSVCQLSVRFFNETGASCSVQIEIGDVSLTSATIANGAVGAGFFHGADQRIPIKSGWNNLTFKLSRTGTGTGSMWVLAWSLDILGKTGLYP